MVIKIKFVLFILIFFSSFKNINLNIIKEAFHFFDVFYYKDIFKNYINQKNNNKCTIEEGPNCYYIPKNQIIISQELNNIYPDQSTFIKEDSDFIYSKLKEEIHLITQKDSESIEDKLYSFDSPLVMSLFLTFESYDEKTRYSDIYSPETIDTQFDIGRLTLTILGKLRISQKNAKLFENNDDIVQPKDEKPKGSYAFVESKEVLIKFNSKAKIASVYIKKNKFNTKNKPFYLYGYKGEKKYVITKMENVPSSRWIKVNGDGNKYDSIILIRGFDYDNFVINAQVSKDNSIDFNKINKKYSEVISERINNAIQDTMKQLKNGADINTIKENGKNVKIIKIDLNQNDILEQNEQEDFDIPEELMDELEKKENKINKERKEKNKKENMNKSDL